MTESSHQISVGIFFGTISGRTAKIAQFLAARITGAPTDCGRSLGLDASRNDHSSIQKSETVAEFRPSVFDLSKTPIERLHDFPIQIWISPTYGKGDLQFHWMNWANSNSRPDLSGRLVFPIALGDKRHHRKTFGGAFEKLVDLALAMRASVCVPVIEQDLGMENGQVPIHGPFNLAVQAAQYRSDSKRCQLAPPLVAASENRSEISSRSNPLCLASRPILVVNQQSDRESLIPHRFVLDFVSNRATSAQCLNAWLTAFKTTAFNRRVCEAVGG